MKSSNGTDIVDKPKYIMTRNWTNLTREDMVKETSEKKNLSSIFTIRNPNNIWTTLILELNKIMKKLAPN